MGAWAIALQSFKGDPLPVCTLKIHLFNEALTIFFSLYSPITLLVTIVYTKTLSIGWIDTVPKSSILVDASSNGSSKSSKMVWEVDR